MAPKAAPFQKGNTAAKEKWRKKSQKVLRQEAKPTKKTTPDRSPLKAKEKREKGYENTWLPKWNDLTPEDKEKYPTWQDLQKAFGYGRRNDGTHGQRNVTSTEVFELQWKLQETEKALAKEKAKNFELEAIFEFGNEMYDEAVKQGLVSARNFPKEGLRGFLLGRRHSQWLESKALIQSDGTALGDPPEWTRTKCYPPDWKQTTPAARETDWKFQLEEWRQKMASKCSEPKESLTPEMATASPETAADQASGAGASGSADVAPVRPKAKTSVSELKAELKDTKEKLSVVERERDELRDGGIKLYEENETLKERLRSSSGSGACGSGSPVLDCYESD